VERENEEQRKMKRREADSRPVAAGCVRASAPSASASASARRVFFARSLLAASFTHSNTQIDTMISSSLIHRPPAVAHGGSRRCARHHHHHHHPSSTSRSALLLLPVRASSQQNQNGPSDDIDISTTTSGTTTTTSDRIEGAQNKPPRLATTAAATVAAFVLLVAPPAPSALAVPLPSLFGGGNNSTNDQQNSSVVRALQQRQKRERLFGAADADPRPLLAARLSAARDEAARVPLLTRINQADSARLLLREKNLANLRRDLAYMTGAYADVVPESEVRGVVEAVERLDGALRKASRAPPSSAELEAATSEVKTLVGDLDARLERVAAAVVALEGEAR
jgi:hypothetical protein